MLTGCRRVVHWPEMAFEKITMPSASAGYHRSSLFCDFRVTPRNIAGWALTCVLDCYLSALNGSLKQMHGEAHHRGIRPCPFRLHRRHLAERGWPKGGVPRH